MPTVRLLNHEYTYQLQDVLHLFYGPVTIVNNTELCAGTSDPLILSRRLDSGDIETSIDGKAEAGYRITGSAADDVSARREVKRQLYFLLSRLTGISYPWGSLTGIRPTYIARQLRQRLGSRERVYSALTGFYGVSPEKADLAIETGEEEDRLMDRFPVNDLAVYIGIPFCPTRCSYCSFSTQEGIARPPHELDVYLDALIAEIRTVWTNEAFVQQLESRGSRVQALYIGGGTPTSFSERQLGRFLDELQGVGLTAEGIELTLEAGRPDTITPLKLRMAKEAGFSRISINPQTMNDETLRRIGRHHGAAEILDAFAMAKAEGLREINMDLIAGLEGENAADFKDSLDRVLALEPHSITVHTLAVKRSSRLHRNLAEKALVSPDEESQDLRARLLRPDPELNAMLAYARIRLTESGLYPYYLYRQKDGRGSLENCAFAPAGEGSLYNVAMMSDSRSVLGFGAGSMSKRVSAGSAERSPNVRNIGEYNTRAEEMARRKLKLWDIV